MTSLLLANTRTETPPSQATVRATADPIDDTPAVGVAPDGIGNDLATDIDGDNTGLVRRDLAGEYRPREKFAPWWSSAATDITDATARLNAQVSTSGSAAQRERDGDFGRGTMAYSRSIAPVIGDNASFGDTYFTGVERPAQDGASAAMTPAADTSYYPGNSTRTTRLTSEARTSPGAWAGFMSEVIGS